MLITTDENKNLVYKDGHFPCKYCGIIKGPWTDNRCTEILSKGLEMLFEAPKTNFKNDFEYFSFIVAILSGKVIEM